VAVTLKTVKELNNFRGDGDYVVSLYLDVDGRKFPRKQAYERELKDLVHQAKKEWLKRRDLSHSQREFLKKDLEAIDQFVRLKFIRKKRKGLAIFSCSARDFWQVYPLPVSLPSCLIIDNIPYTKPLTTVLDEYERYCTVVVDRRKARIFTVYLGEIEEHSGVFEDDVPNKVKAGEWAALRESKISHHIEDHVHRHLKNVAQKTLKFFKENDFHRLIIGGHREIIPKFEKHLPDYLRKRVAGHFLAKPEVSLKDILEESLRLASSSFKPSTR